MNKLSIYTTLFFGVFSLGVMAQRSDSSIGSEVVNVIGTYTPTISDAFKVKETPSFEDETVTNKESINYSISSFPVASTFTPNKGKAEQVQKAEKEKYFSNYATLGIGNYGTVLGELYVTHNLGRNEYIGGMLRHHSSQGGINDVVLDDFFYDTSVDLTYAKFERTYNWRADVGFQNQIYNWYGLPIKYVDFTEEQIGAIDEKQSYNSFYVGGKVNMLESIFNGGEVYFKRFWDAHQSGENRFWIKPTFDVPVSDFDIKSDLILDYVGTTYEKNLAGNADLKYSFFNIGLQPHVLYQMEDLSLRAGVGLFYSSGKFNSESDSKFFVYPQVQLSYKVVGDLMIMYAGAEGSLEQNSYADMVDENPFIAPGQPLMPTNRQYEIYVGAKGKLASNIAYNVKGSFMNEEDKLLYATMYDDTFANTEGFAFGNSMGVLYDNVNTVRISGEIKADINKNFSVNAGGKFNAYSTEFQEEAWYLPTLELSAGADFAVNEKLSFNANIFYVGERKAYAEYNSTPHEVKLDGYVDINLRADYKLNQRFSVFLKLNNIADQKYEKWLNYPAQGIQVMAGAGYKFDF